jgi:Signal transduction histidine kinase
VINFIIIVFIIVGFIISIKTGVLLLLISLIFLLDKKHKDKKLEDISKQIDDILYHDKELYINEYNEGALCILENEIQKLVLKLHNQNELLQQERLLLKESLEDVSHQIKTPLTSLNLIVERLKDNQLTNQEKKELLKEEIKLLDKIEWLIQSLMKLAQIDAHSIKFNEEEIDCDELIKKVIEPFEIYMDLKDIQLEYEHSKETILYGDKQWILEAISNIVKNCLEHLDVGGILKIVIEDNPLYSEVIIQDNGKGIDPKDLPHLFERFYKGQNSHQNSVGIGLALSKKIIESQNGIITAENSYPGAKFIIHFYKETI